MRIVRLHRGKCLDANVPLAHGVSGVADDAIDLSPFRDADDDTASAMAASPTRGSDFSQNLAFLCPRIENAGSDLFWSHGEIDVLHSEGRECVIQSVCNRRCGWYRCTLSKTLETTESQ